MPSYLLSSAVLIAVALVLRLAWQSISWQIRYRRAKAKHGCQPLRHAPQRDPFFALDHFVRLVRAAHSQSYLETFQKWFLEVGSTFGVNLMGDYVIFTNEPQNVQALLVTRFADFELGQRRRNNSWELLGVGVFNADGDDWAHGRALVRPNFTRKQVADLPLFERHIQKLFRVLPADGSAVDMQEMAFRFTMDAGTEVLLDESTNILLPGATDVARKFSWAFEKGIDSISQRIRLGRFAKLFYDPEYTRACHFVHDYIDVIAVKAAERAKQWHAEKGGTGQEADMQQSPENEERYTFLNALARTGAPSKQIRDQVLNTLVAARDTSACLMSAAIFEMARRPEYQARLREEIAQHLGSEPPTFESLKSLVFLSYFIKECLRMYPPIPLNQRVAKNDTTLPTGGGPDGTAPVFIGAGQMVVYQVYSMHRREDLWGDDAAEFRPERWETSRAKFEYLPFNAGPRICPGQKFALVETSYVLVRLLQEYKNIAPRDDGSPWREHLTLTCSVGQGVWVSLTK
ncbi:hypothetical protein QQS21_000889 [Conoideocrella luteorostrata]|uniref:Cytochrome P450 n=1 Tax=Conoideocrella luteorostrata TaxID=1105319 RepID=A0AAJ0CY75_9HYPO|nr:hypothetical protein QQS21_000889 [Conoideocrella luteorostrata]